MSLVGLRLRRDQRGITGIETAIVLIAFVVVAAVFAFTIMSSGVLATEETKKSVLGGLQDVSSALVLRGSVIGLATTTAVQTLTFQVTAPLRTDGSVSLSSSDTVITYIDSQQAADLVGWTTQWLSGSGDLLDSGERVEFSLDLTGLVTGLGASTEFTIQVKPKRGGILVINRTTPPALPAVIDFR